MKFLFFSLSGRMQDGGPEFMYPLLIMLLLCVGFLVYAFIKGDATGKLQKIISHISLFALVYGFLGFMMGMIGALDAISIANDIATSVLAGGLKIGMLSPSFGMLVFLISRLGLMGLTLKEK